MMFDSAVGTKQKILSFTPLVAFLCSWKLWPFLSFLGATAFAMLQVFLSLLRLVCWCLEFSTCIQHVLDMEPGSIMLRDGFTLQEAMSAFEVHHDPHVDLQ
jgi:hypothetical protein